MQLITKWEKTGLLENLENDTYKEILAKYLENVIDRIKNEKDDLWCFLSFPMVRRIFDRTGKEMNYDKMKKIFNEQLNTFKSLSKESGVMIPELKFMTLLVDIYIEEG